MFKPEAVTHYAEWGRIYCPVRQADLSVDACYGCHRLHEVQRDLGRVRAIRCTGSVPVPFFSEIR